jgi:hypothetical protein
VYVGAGVELGLSPSPRSCVLFHVTTYHTESACEFGFQMELATVVCAYPYDLSLETWPFLFERDRMEDRMTTTLTVRGWVRPNHPTVCTVMWLRSVLGFSTHFLACSWLNIRRCVLTNQRQQA